MARITTRDLDRIERELVLAGDGFDLETATAASARSSSRRGVRSLR